MEVKHIPSTGMADNGWEMGMEDYHGHNGIFRGERSMPFIRIVAGKAGQSVITFYFPVSSAGERELGEMFETRTIRIPGK